MKNKCGFTLIELLAVVLIVAVLVAVAAPQYQTAVLRVKYLKLQRVVHKVMEAEQRYHAATGDFTVDLNVLDIEFPPWEFEHKITQPNENGWTGAQYNSQNGDSLGLINVPNYLQIRMSSPELPVQFEMFDFHYPNMAINPDVMKEHLIESYCNGSADNVTESRRICGAFGADTTTMSADYSWKF